MKKISITHVNNAHNDWIRALDFYKQELNILKSRLSEIAGKNSAADVLKQVEHFENAFKVQRDNIDRLNHDVHLNVVSIGNQLQESKAGYIDAALLTQHNNLHERFTAEEKAINELRHQFTQFSADWM